MFDYIQDAGLRFAGPLKYRTATKGIVLHHFASEASLQAIHEYGISLGWLGVGYNVVIMLDGTVWYGRGLDAVGAHAGRKNKASPAYATAIHNNDETIGIAFQGMFHAGSKNTRTSMPAIQYQAGVKLIWDIIKAYPEVAFIKGHKDMPACLTVCPGQYFPLADMIEDGLAVDEPLPLALDEYYAIQVGAYKKKANAENMLKSLKSKGYNPFILIKDTAKKTYKDI